MEQNTTQQGIAARLAGDWRFHAMALLLLAGFAVVVWYINAGQDLWLDEIETMGWAHSPFDKIHVRAGANNHTALYFWLMHSWVKGGDSELWLKIPTLLMFLATVPLVYMLGRVIRSPLTGLIAAALFVTSPYMIRYAGEVRPYALLPLLAAAGFLCMAQLVSIYRSDAAVHPFALSLRRLRDPRVRPAVVTQNLLWLGVAAFTFLLMITHMSATVAPLALGLAAVGVALFMGRWKPFAISMGVALLLVSVLYLALPFGLEAFLSAYKTVGAPTPLWGMIRRTIGVWVRHPLQLLVFLPLLLLIARWRSENRHWIPFLLILMLTLPLIVMGYDLVMDSPVYRKRTLIWTAVPFYILAGLALTHIGRTAIVTLAATVAVAMLLALNVYVAVSGLGGEKSSWGQVARDVREQKEPKDAVLYCPGYYGGVYRYYESPELRFNKWSETDYYYKWHHNSEDAPQPARQQPDARPFGENDRVWVLINRLQERRLCRVDRFHEMLAGEGFQVVERWHYGDALVGLYEKGEPASRVE